MFNRIKSIISPSVRITFVNFALKLVFKFLLLLFVPLYLSSSEMGFWYTFISIAALTTFADLGFTTIITQFSAHEAVKVKFNTATRNFDDSDDKIADISSLFNFSIKWSGSLTAICSIVIVLIGLFVFGKDNSSNSYWVIPWVIYAIASALNFFNQVFLAFFEGCNQIVTSQKIKIVNGLIVNGLGVIGLLFGWGLYALSIPMLLSVVVSYLQVAMYYGKVILRMFRCQDNSNNQWAKEILRLLWKYALSWGSGYLIFQIYNPLVFSRYGAETAGQVGYLLTIVGAFVSIANVWSYVSVPKINMLTEKKKWKELDSLFNKNIFLIEFTFIIEFCACNISRYLPYIGIFVNKYIFSFPAFLILSIGYAVQLAISYIGVYLRSHKEEPLMVSSIITAIISVCVTVFCLYALPVDWIFGGFTTSVIVMLPVVLRIKKTKRQLWHQ